MGREIRRVPPDWKHPTDDGVGDNQCWIPLHEGPYSEYSAGYDREAALWALGRHPDQREYPANTKDETYPCWVGRKRLAEEYMPEFAPGTATAFQMYETTSEGSPRSPVFETFDALVEWWMTNASREWREDPEKTKKYLTSLLPEERAKRDVSKRKVDEALAASGSAFHGKPICFQDLSVRSSVKSRHGDEIVRTVSGAFCEAWMSEHAFLKLDTDEEFESFEDDHGPFEVLHEEPVFVSASARIEELEAENALLRAAFGGTRPLNAETAGEWTFVDYSVLKSDPDWRWKHPELPDYAECIRLCTGEPIRVEVRLEGGCRFKVMMTPNKPGYCRELFAAEEPDGIGVALERGRAWGSAFAEGWRLAKEAK